ncbi:hypothetical protein [Hyphomicrobium sp. CS1GBMeth3]|uniref:hypothetical protein n=1 Tax=Hyphomicrobium sp. CS1GBMeth3 TaxID=1892845 RepID=UPI000930F8C9|nr:hypothetical protein [Hyphomicrobium sp. CS1GBMeth3]
MTFMKSAAVAAIVATAALGTTMSAAEAGKKHLHGVHKHHHHKFHHHFYGPKIVIGSSDYGCKHWLYRYKKTGKKYFLNRYYACIY